MQIGDSVKVRKCVLDSEFEKYKISGWQGRILEIYDIDDIQLEIELDSITLKEIPKEYIWESLDNGSDYAIIDVLFSDVVIVEPRDTVDEVKAVRQKMNEELDYVSMLDEDEEVIKNTIIMLNSAIRGKNPGITYEEIKYPFLN
ncbi:MAG: hypothetical protein HY951_19195 [Bacteroidia bacterium]|nr:hypothetical protein [Bacteroidia bacterium]